MMTAHVENLLTFSKNTTSDRVNMPEMKCLHTTVTPLYPPSEELSVCKFFPLAS